MASLACLFWPQIKRFLNASFGSQSLANSQAFQNSWKNIKSTHSRGQMRHLQCLVSEAEVQNRKYFHLAIAITLSLASEGRGEGKFSFLYKYVLWIIIILIIFCKNCFPIMHLYSVQYISIQTQRLRNNRVGNLLFLSLEKSDRSEWLLSLFTEKGLAK